jgi:uncharacterized short protein YbdD (DUF466 family)
MNQLKHCYDLLLRFLKEISDESAYLRYLERHGMEPTRQSWQSFHEECLQSRFTRPKCC